MSETDRLNDSFCTNCLYASVSSFNSDNITRASAFVVLQASRVGGVLLRVPVGLISGHFGRNVFLDTSGNPVYIGEQGTELLV
jgi:hypothetical protein